MTKNPKDYQTFDYGTIHRNTITKLICDKFGAERERKNDGTILIFDKEKLLKVGSVYNLRSSIQTKLLEYEDSSSEGSESSEGCVGSRVNRCTAIQVYHAIDKGRIEVFRNNDTRIARNITTNFANITNKQSDKAILDTETINAYLPEPSQPTQPSPSLLGIINNQSTVLATPFEFSQTIYRLGHSDIFACRDCKLKGDIWFMKQHICKTQSK